ncbi:MAG: methyltransferase family protein [Candidatus Hermodarchaeota archaeon]
MMKDNIKKIIAILFLIPFINLGFIIFNFEVYLNLNTLIIIISFTLILSIDIIIRPISQRRDQYKYTKLSILLFLLLPLISIVPYLEFKLLIQQYFIIWNNYSLFIAGIIVLLLGGILLIYSRILLGKFASSKIIVEQNHTLMTNGIYKYIRHPIYLGMLLVFFGYGLSFKSCITPFTFLILFFIIFNNRMNLEEKLLKEKFGRDYELYLERSKRLIPYIY